MGRRDALPALREMRVDEGLALLMGTWDPESPAPSNCRVRVILESVRFREALVEDNRNRCDPTAIC